MTFRTNRLYCLLTKRFWIQLLPLLPFGILAVVICWKNESNFRILLTAIPIMLVVLGVMHLLNEPGEFTIGEQEITLHLCVRRKLPRFVLVNKRNSTVEKLTVVMRGVRQIEYRSFNGDQVGNIRIFGELYAEDFDGDCADIVDVPEYVELCGVSNLTEVLWQLKKVFPSAVQIRK